MAASPERTEGTVTEKNRWMIYGSNGYTGKLIVEHAKKNASNPILAGRSAEKINPLAQQYGFESRIFSLDSPEAIENALSDVYAMVLIAGPYELTSKPVVDACIKTKTHYLDVTGEIPVFEDIFARDSEAKIAGVALLPGLGLDIVVTDCLAAMLRSCLPSASHLQMCLFMSHGDISPGTARTIIRSTQGGLVVRKASTISRVNIEPTAEFYYPEKNVVGMSISWGDVSTAYYSTGIPNISCYVKSPSTMMPSIFGQLAKNVVFGALKYSWGRWLANKYVDMFISGAGPEIDDEENYVVALGVVWDESTGKSVSGHIKTENGYVLTAKSVVKAAERLNTTHVNLTGALTPSMAFGEDYIMEFRSSKSEFSEGSFSAQERRSRFPF